jgi:sarcosine oxidase
VPNLKLRVTRQVVGWIWPRDPERFRRPQFPVWLIEPIGNEPRGGVYYGLPLSTRFDEGIGLKFGWHCPGREMPVAQITGEITDADREEIRRPLRYFKDADGDLLAVKVCKYTNSPDGHFILDRHPESDRSRRARHHRSGPPRRSRARWQREDTRRCRHR